MPLEVGQYVNDGRDNLLVCGIKEYNDDTYVCLLNESNDLILFYMLKKTNELWKFKKVKEENLIKRLIILFSDIENTLKGVSE